MKKFTVSLIVIAFAFYSNAQMVVDNSQTPDSLVQNHLLGAGVYVSNVTYNGSLSQLGSFTGGAAGIANGIIMSTGSVDSSGGAWAPWSVFRSSAMFGNPDSSLANIVTPNIIYDAAVLEFDFKVASDSVKFNFIFGSEEYNEWVNTGFNDVFGFFISGPGIVGEQNIALIPGTTTPVSINMVNNGNSAGASTGPCMNCAYYHDNVGDTTFAFDGYTTVLTAQAAVQPCTVYHIKLAVADVSDMIFDSFVMLEDNSFQACSSPRLSANNTPVLTDTITICAGSSVQLSSVQSPNYLWSTGETTQTITVTQSGDYVASVFEGACYVTSKMVHVEVLTLPAPALSNVGATITSTVTDPSYTYSWYHDGTLITGAASSAYIVITGGCYQLIVTDANGCSVASNLLCLTFTGIDYVTDNNAVQVIPNPFKHSARISFANPSNEKVTVTVYDASGREIRNSKFEIRNLRNNEVELINKSLENGIYLFELRNPSSQITGKGKLVIE